MADFAVWHIGVNGRRYKPGERLPEMDEATWARLARAGAIRTEYEANPPTSADLSAQTAARGDAPGAKSVPGTAEQDEPEDEDDEALPEIDATEGIVEEEEKPAKRKRARA
mgnify:CR=1 FL=1